MSLIFDKNILGTKENISVPFNESLSLPRIGSKSFEELARLYSISLPNFPSEAYRRAYRTFVSGSSIPWQKCMPKTKFDNDFLQYSNSILEQVNFIENNISFDYYKNTFLPNQEMFKYLEPCKIDKDKFDSKFELNTNHGLHALKTFKPQKNNFTSDVEYSTSSTLTGRLTVTSGPNILHLKKEYRDIICSRWGSEGTIFYLDFKSLEPRTILLLNQLHAHNIDSYKGSLPLIKYCSKIPPDIYTHLITELNLPSSVGRDEIKTTILALLYGATKESVVYKLKPMIESPEDLVDLVVEYFGLDKLKSRLTQMYVSNDRKFITNFYGRPIFCEDTTPSTLVNYYIQSTAVDISLYGYNKIISRLVEKELLEWFVPLFSLHDALILDVHNSVKHHINKLASLGQTIPGFSKEQKFYLDVTIF